jgi:hypothetical protein
MGGSSWNNSRPNDEDYSLELWGTVVSLQEVQARMYNPGGKQPGAPRFWPDGNPVMNIRMGLATPDGSLKSVIFAKAGKKQVSGEKPSLHMQLFALTNNNMMELIGKTIHLWTWPANPQTGQTWGQGNPRLFGVEEVTNGTKYELSGPLPPEFMVPELMCNDGAQGGQPMPPNMIQQPQVPPMQGNFYAPPTAQPMMQQQYQPAPMQQQQYQQAPAMQQQYQPAPVQQLMPQQQALQGMNPMAQVPTTQMMPPQQQTAQMPQGMDPAVAQAMQAVGAVNVQPVQSVGQPEGDPTGGIYDDGIPF